MKDDFEGLKVNRTDTRNDLVEMPYKNNQSPTNKNNKEKPPDKRVIGKFDCEN